MGDSTTVKINRFFDVVDAAIDQAGTFVNRNGKTAQKLAAAKRGNVVDVDAEPSQKKPSTAVARARFRIIESIDAVTGRTLFVVTDGATRTECTSAADAERVRGALESA